MQNAMRKTKSATLMILIELLSDINPHQKNTKNQPAIIEPLFAIFFSSSLTRGVVNRFGK